MCGLEIRVPNRNPYKNNKGNDLNRTRNANSCWYAAKN